MKSNELKQWFWLLLFKNNSCGVVRGSHSGIRLPMTERLDLQVNFQFVFSIVCFVNALDYSFHTFFVLANDFWFASAR